MAEGLFTGFAGFGNVMQWLIYAGYFVLFLLILGVFIGLILFILVKSKEKTIREISAITRQEKTMSGRPSRGQSGKIHLWIAKLKKFMPQIQQEDIFLNKRKEVIYLYKDNNGLHHTLRLPTEEELKKWYKVVEEIDIDEELELLEDEESKELSELKPEERLEQGLLHKIMKKPGRKYEVIRMLGTLFWLPNPAEDLNWMAHQFKESDKEFPSVWWKNPQVMFIAMAAMCVIMFLMTMIIAKKM